MKSIAEGLRQAATHIAELMDISNEETHQVDPYLLKVVHRRCERTTERIEEYYSLYNH